MNDAQPCAASVRIAMSKRTAIARVRKPVASVHVCAGCEHLARQPRDQREAKWARRYVPQRALELGQHRIHERGVECVRDVQGARRDAVRLEPAQRRAYRFALAGDDGMRRAVDGSDRDFRFERSGNSLHISEDGSHFARRRERLHQARTFDDKPKPFFERERSRKTRRRVLADAVTEDEVRLDAPRPPQLRERIFEREERGLRVSRFVESRRLPVKHREQWPFENWAQDFVALLQRAAEAWLRL